MTIGGSNAGVVSCNATSLTVLYYDAAASGPLDVQVTQELVGVVDTATLSGAVTAGTTAATLTGEESGHGLPKSNLAQAAPCGTQ